MKRQVKNPFAVCTRKVAVGTLCAFMLSLCLVVVGCEKPDTPPLNSGGGEDTIKENLTLQGTKWKLVGLFDANTDSLIKELEPKDCEECYTLGFGILYTWNLYDSMSFYIHSSTNGHTGTYEIDYKTSKIRIIEYLGTFLGEKGDGRLFSNILRELRNEQLFSSRENELKWYYNDGKSYLLFKPCEP